MRILHTMLRVSDLDRSLMFYMGVLGMKLISRRDYPEGRFTLAFLGFRSRVEGRQGPEAELELTWNWDTKSYERGTAYGHIAVGVDDARRACADVEARGGRVVRPAGPMKHGTTVIAFVEDPDGYKIEFIERRDELAAGKQDAQDHTDSVPPRAAAPIAPAAAASVRPPLEAATPIAGRQALQPEPALAVAIANEVQERHSTPDQPFASTENLLAPRPLMVRTMIGTDISYRRDPKESTYAYTIFVERHGDEVLLTSDDGWYGVKRVKCASEIEAATLFELVVTDPKAGLDKIYGQDCTWFEPLPAAERAPMLSSPVLPGDEHVTVTLLPPKAKTPRPKRQPDMNRRPGISATNPVTPRR